MQIITEDIYKGMDLILDQFNNKSTIISIAGGSCSGKTGLIKNLQKELNNDLVVLALDSYYLNDNKTGNFDHPDALDLSLAYEHLIDLKNNMPINKPVYDFKTSSRIGFEEVYPKKHILFEGLFSLYSMFREISNYNVFMDVDINVALERRIKRDVLERGRKEVDVIRQFYETVKPMYELFIKPQKQIADLVIVNNTYRPEFNKAR